MGDISVKLSLIDLESLALELVSVNRWRVGRRTKLLKALVEGSGILDLLEQAERKQQAPQGDPRFLLAADPEINAPLKLEASTTMVKQQPVNPLAATRIAIIGCGEIADSYAASLDHSWQVVAVYDVNEERARTLSTRLHTRLAPSLQDAFQDAELAINLTPADCHAEVTRIALNAGLHVWSEKPLAATASEAWELRSLAVQRGLKLGCAPISIWGEAQQSLLTYLPKIGRIHLVEASVHVAGSSELREGGWRNHPRYSLGSLRDCGIYALHLLTAYLGPAKYVFAQSGKDALDLWVLHLECQSGAKCVITCTQSLPSSHRSLHLYGASGSASLKEMWDFDTTLQASADQEISMPIPYTHPPTSRHAPHPHACNWMRGATILMASAGDLAAQACHVLEIIEAAEMSCSSGAYVAVHSEFNALPRLPRCVPRRAGVSRLVLGVLALSKLGSKAEAFRLLDQAWALGVNAFDSAHVYGAAESTLGAWIQARQVPRDAIFLIGKAGHPRRDGCSRLRDASAVRKDVFESTQRLGVSYLDVVLLHRDDETMSVEEVLDVLVPLRQEGIVHAWGVSNWHPQRVASLATAAANRGERIAMNSPQVSLATPTRPVYDGTVHWDTAAEAVSKQHDVPTLGWSALAGGFLVQGCGDPLWANAENDARRRRLQEISQRTNLSVAAWAVRYVLSIVEHAVVGTTCAQHLVDLARGTKGCDEQITRWLRDGGELPQSFSD